MSQKQLLFLAIRVVILILIFSCHYGTDSTLWSAPNDRAVGGCSSMYSSKGMR